MRLLGTKHCNSDMPACVQGVANRDIKLENCLLDGAPRPLIKICDFGYSKVSALLCDVSMLQCFNASMRSPSMHSSGNMDMMRFRTSAPVLLQVIALLCLQRLCQGLSLAMHCTLAMHAP